MLPDTCPTCHAVARIDSRYLPTLDVRVRVYDCGCALGAGTNAVYTTIACPRTADVLAQLRADNVRIGDRNVLLAIATQGAIEALEDTLQGWATQTLETLPKVGLLRLSPIRAAYDELVDALEGAAPAPAAEVPHEPLSSGSASLNVSAAEHVGERSCTNSTPG